MAQTKVSDGAKVRYIKSQTCVTEFIDQINMANMIGSDGTSKITVIFGRDVADVIAETIIVPDGDEPAHGRVMPSDVDQYRLVLANLSMPMVVAERLAHGLLASIEKIREQQGQE